MASSINERFLDFQIAQQVRWIRFQNREVREARKILMRVDADLKAALEGARIGEGTFTEARLNALRVQITNLINATHMQVTASVTTAVKEVSIAAAEVEHQAFTRILPAGLDVTTPNLGVLQTAASLRPFNGGVLADWTDQLRVADLQRTWRTILDGITSGTTTDDLVSSLIGTRSLRYKDGVREVTRRGLEALVRTSINHATNQGRQMVWEANSDLLKGVRWVSTLDSRTTPICQERDGKVGPVVEDPNWSPPQGSDRLDPPMARPPAHMNCRSTTVAVTKSWQELGFDVKDLPEGTRASMNGQVPASMTYFQWLDKQSTATQKEVLGPTRLALWKEGGITPDRFQNDAGHLYTLAELKQRQPQAFKDAGL